MHDLDLTSPTFRLDTKTIILLLALAGQWWDQRNQLSNMAEVMVDVKRKADLASFEVNSIKLALAEHGYHFTTKE